MQSYRHAVNCMPAAHFMHSCAVTYFPHQRAIVTFSITLWPWPLAFSLHG